MPNAEALNPAERAAQETLARVYQCIDQHRNFLVEAGAGAGKTYSLVNALRYVIEKQGKSLQRRNQRVACITYTNVASDEIASRTDNHPAVHSNTIHAFCWSLIKQFQPTLRTEVQRLDRWPSRLEEVGGIGLRAVDYNLGYPVVEEDRILLHHNDVLSLTVALMEHAKFRTLFTERYPVLFIDEYQDTDKSFADAISKHFLGTTNGPQIGFFGDHWQKIYGNGCGRIEHAALERIGKEANFRSVPAVVAVLNHMRPNLPQQVTDPTAQGFVGVFHTNRWAGERLTGGHWDGDLPSETCHRYLESLTSHLTSQGWDFVSPNVSKILMLTHRVLATEQGYSQLLQVFPNNDALIKKEDPYIAFFLDLLEPVCTAYERKNYGDMFSVIGSHAPTIRSQADKTRWSADMDKLLALRVTATIGTVLDHIRQTQLHLPNAIERKERQSRQSESEANSDNAEAVDRLRQLKGVPYKEIIALAKFVDGHTPFSTKHGVKGAEFDNILVVVGRGWNLYDFNRMLEWAGANVPSNKIESFERNRNLFYVACSRPKRRLALLFTQRLSTQALSTLGRWFGQDTIHAL